MHGLMAYEYTPLLKEKLKVSIKYSKYIEQLQLLLLLIIITSDLQYASFIKLLHRTIP